MHTSVIVIHDTNNRYNYDSVRAWFAESGLEAYEAVDLFDAIDKISDFTTTVCPDVYLVKVLPGSQQDRMIPEFELGFGLLLFLRVLFRTRGVASGAPGTGEVLVHQRDRGVHAVGVELQENRE